MKSTSFSTGTILLAAALTVNAQNPNATIADNLQALSNSTSTKSYNLSTILSLGSGIDSVKGVLTGSNNVTLFAPTDEAFKNFNASHGDYYKALAADQGLLTAALDYHVLPNGVYNFNYSSNGKVYQPTAYYSTPLPINAQSADNITLTSSDGATAKVVDHIPSSNGVIYVIDNILVPPQTLPEVLNATGLTTLSQVLTSNNNLNTTIYDTKFNNYTLFAPTNDALAKFLTFAQQNNINGSNPDILTNLVYYHVLPNQEDSAADFIAWKNVTLPTNLAGNATIRISVEDGKVIVYGAGTDALKLSPATVTKPNQIARGGIFHVVDAVIVPTNDSLNTAPPSSGGNATTGPDNAKGGASKVAGGMVTVLAVAAAVALVL